MNNAAAIVLTKQSNQTEIRAYFKGVMRLVNSSEQFPVNLDEVWPLVYGKKSDAVEALKADFIQDVDYQVLRQNPQNPNGGRPTDSYYISTSCLEYFIARKVRPVFEVYRQVFHKAATAKQLSPSEMLLQSVQMLVENERKVAQLESKVQEIDVRTTTRPEYFTVAGYCRLMGYKASAQMCNTIGRRASKACKRRGWPIDEVPDTRWGTVGSYPKSILDEVSALQNKTLAKTV
jgi:hypothetical protein